MKKLLCAALVLCATSAFAQLPASIVEGINLYGKGLWKDAINMLRSARGTTPEQRASALYWLVLAEIENADYEFAQRDLALLETISTDPAMKKELAFHKGRCLYFRGAFNEALVMLKTYADSIASDAPDGNFAKSAALYWSGECAYALGNLDSALALFSTVTHDFPKSNYFEHASRRIAFINEKKIEAELLSLLQKTHEESLSLIEEYQRKERVAEQDIIAYQKRITALEARLREAGLNTGK